MDISKFKHDPSVIHKCVVKTPDKKLVTPTGCKLCIPVGYTSKSLAIIGSEVSILGVCAFYNDKFQYGVSMATSMATLGPNTMETVEMDGEPYYVFTFEPGSVVFVATEMVRDKKLVNAILDYFNDYGHSPWFMSDLLQSELLRDTRYWNDISLGGGQVVYDMMVAPLARDPKNIKTQFRHALKSESEIHTRPILLPSRDIGANASSNLARLNGSEMKVGIKSALLSKVEREEDLEKLFIK